MSRVEVCAHSLSYDQKSIKIMECLPHSHQYREEILYKFCRDFVEEGNTAVRWLMWSKEARASCVMTWLDRNTTVSTRTKKDYQAMLMAQIHRVLQSNSLIKPRM